MSKFYLSLFSFLLFSLSHFIVQAQVSSGTEILPSGEVLVVHEIIVDASLEQVWKAFTEEEEWKKWLTPEVEIKLSINGTIRSHYTAGAELGGPGTIEIKILYFIPYKQITMQAVLGDSFGPELKLAEKNLYSVYEFESLGRDETKVSLYGIGYPDTAEWKETLEFFRSNNEASLLKLQEHLNQKDN